VTAVVATLAGAWAMVVCVVASDAAARATRRRPTRRGPAPAAVPRSGTRRGTAGRSPAAALGGAVLRLAGRRDQAADDPARRRTGRAALAAGALLPLAPALAAVPLVLVLAGPPLAARRDAVRREAAVVDQLPDIVDLLALTATAGLPVPAALATIGDRPGGPLGAACARAGAVVRRGGTTADALAELAAAGPAVRPLVDALAQHVRYGTPLVPALDRVGIEARARRRRRAEEAARRLPVALLFPLVLTTFPAFVLLTVVPLLAGSFGSLSLTPV
jgi:Flp pilus assembly protein TadB